MNTSFSRPVLAGIIAMTAAAAIGAPSSPRDASARTLGNPALDLRTVERGVSVLTLPVDEIISPPTAEDDRVWSSSAVFDAGAVRSPRLSGQPAVNLHDIVRPEPTQPAGFEFHPTAASSPAIAAGALSLAEWSGTGWGSP